MSSVSRSVDCPQCKYPDATHEFQTRDYSEDTFCPRCGYHYRYFPLCTSQRDKDNPHRRWLKLRKDGKMIFRTITQQGYGAYRILPAQGCGVGGCLPKDAKKRALCIKQIKQDAKDHPDWSIDLFILKGKKVVPIFYSQQSKEMDEIISKQVETFVGYTEG